MLNVGTIPCGCPYKEYGLRVIIIKRNVVMTDLKELFKSKITRLTISIIGGLIIPVPIYDSCMSACGENYEGACLDVCISGFRFESVVSKIMQVLTSSAVNDSLIAWGEIIYVFVIAIIYFILLYALLGKIFSRNS